MRKSTVLLVTALSVCGIAGCSQAATPPSAPTDVQRVLHASRATLYDSYADLAADSTLVVLGTVLSQDVLHGDVDVTVSTVDIDKVLPAASLGAHVRRQASNPATATPTSVAVRQMGSSAYSELPAPLLTEGTQYLLFLTPSQMPGEAASQYYITGADAGVLLPEHNGFTRMNLESGDSLPTTVSASGLASGAS